MWTIVLAAAGSDRALALSFCSLPRDWTHAKPRAGAGGMDPITALAVSSGGGPHSDPQPCITLMGLVEGGAIPARTRLSDIAEKKKRASRALVRISTRAALGEFVAHELHLKNSPESAHEVHLQISHDFSKFEIFSLNFFLLVSPRREYRTRDQ